MEKVTDVATRGAIGISLAPNKSRAICVLRYPHPPPELVRRYRQRHFIFLNQT